MKSKEGICGICPGGCWVEIHFKEGKIEKLKPSKKYEPSILCLRGVKAKDIIYSKNRLKKPLIQVGKKGEGKFREATWEEALDEIEENFKKIIENYGVHTLGSHFGRGLFDSADQGFLVGSNLQGNDFGFFGPLGSPNNFSVGSLCYNTFGVFAPLSTMGILGKNIIPDFEKSDSILIWGANPPTQSPPLLFRRLLKLQQKGTKLISIDHFKNSMAEASDEYIEIRSGTDHYLILSMISFIIKEKLFDQEFVEKYTYGFTELKDYVKDFTLEKSEKITGVSVEKQKLLIDELVKKKVSLSIYTGLEYTNTGVQAIRALYILFALCGHLDTPGGLYLKENQKDSYFLKEKGRKSFMPKIGESEFPFFTHVHGQAQFMAFPKSVLEEIPYKIRGLINFGGNISVNYPNSKVFYRALKELDFFVTIDRFFTKDCEVADVILPSTTYFEKESFVDYPNKVMIREKIIEPIGDSKPDLEIMRLIAERLGFGYYFPKNLEEHLTMTFKKEPEILEKLLSGEKEVYRKNKEKKYFKYQTHALREDGLKGFPTPSTKFEFKSLLLESFGIDGLPYYEESWEGAEKTPEIFKDFPLTLNTGARIQSTFRSQHLNIPSLVEYQENPLIHMNSEDAKKRDIQTGDLVKISSPRGEIKMIANVIKDIPEGEVEVNIGGGSPGQLNLWEKANTNFLTDEKNVDPISGFPAFKDLLCQVEKWTDNK